MIQEKQPPAQVSELQASRVLVIAPHPDDEVVGCGGLLAKLARAGAQIEVLLLSDGSGGRIDPVSDPAAYAARRRREAQAAADVLGIRTLTQLDLPDGELSSARAQGASAIRDRLCRTRPDLVLAPAPTEISLDHRAGFFMLADVLSSSRPGDSLASALEHTSFLLYEVNHPGYPEILVDVSAEVPAIERAMRCHQSQLERHDYLAAALGLRRYRTLSLPRQVTAAEAYSRLALRDFVLRSPAELARDLGGAGALGSGAQSDALVSVIVRTKDRPAYLREALASIAASHHRQTELVLVNDGGAPASVPGDFPFQVRRCDLTPGRGRAAAAQAGIDTATGAYICFLDDDDLVAPDHLSTLLSAAAASGSRVVYSDAAASVYELSASGTWQLRERRLPYSRDFDRSFLLLDNYIPLNTLLIERDLLRQVGPVDTDLPFFEDWDLLIRLSALTPFLHLRRVTCEYRHFVGGTQIFGENPRTRADFLAVKSAVIAKHRDALTPAILARAVDTLRAEAVRAGDLEHEVSRLRAGLDQAQAELARIREVAERPAMEALPPAHPLAALALRGTRQLRRIAGRALRILRTASARRVGRA